MARETKVIFLITGLAYGGAETQLVYLTTRLKKRGWKVRVVSLTPPKAYVEELEATGVPVISLGIRRKLPTPQSVLQLVKLIRSWRPQIIHSHMVHANLLARLVRPLTFMPTLICTAHSINEGSRLREFLYRLTDPLCDLTTQVSRAGLERYVRVKAVPRHKIRYIPNGVDTERFRPNPDKRSYLRAKLDLEARFVWFAVGRFHASKDYPNMLQAFAMIVKKRTEVALLIVGEGPLRSEMERLAQELEIGEYVRFLGIRRDVPELMNAADAYVMSSAWEGMANVLLEASATGLPIVATDVGGNGEIVIDGETGFLVPPKNPNKLAQAMLRLMSLPQEERKHMGERARQYVEENFSLERVVDRWEHLYCELLLKKGIL